MRTAVALLAALAITACGSEREKSAPAHAPKADHQTQTGSESDCQSMIAVASNGAKMTKETRRIIEEYRKAMESKDSAGLCASDVDQLDDEGWTPYAPLGPTSGQKRGKTREYESAYPTP